MYDTYNDERLFFDRFCTWFKYYFCAKNYLIFIIQNIKLPGFVAH